MNLDKINMPESIACILRAIKKCRNPEFQQWVKDYRYPYISKLIECGDLNPDKILYITNTDSINAGFCAMIVQTLNVLSFVDRMKMEPVIEWSKKYYCLQEDLNKEGGPFDYYYDQPSGVSVIEAKNSKNVIMGRAVDGYTRTGPLAYVRTDEALKKSSKLYSKYFHLNASVKMQLSQDALWSYSEENIKVLGVHVRGGDYKKNFKGHPSYISAEQFLSKAIEFDEKYAYHHIFLATDDKEAVSIFSAYFGDRLYYYKDTARSADDNGVHVLGNKDGKRLGYEVLRDYYTLAQCSALIGSFSNVTYVARLEKLRSGQDYEQVEYLNDGVNK